MLLPITRLLTSLTNLIWASPTSEAEETGKKKTNHTFLIFSASMATISSWSLSCSTSLNLCSNVSFSSCSFLHSLWAWAAWPLTVSRYSCNPLMTLSKSFFRASFAAICPKQNGKRQGDNVYKKMLSRYIITAFSLFSYLLLAKKEILSFQWFCTILFFLFKT